jgi:hypothetical protein
VTWSAPIANGSPITAYAIYIKTAAGALVQDLTNCDGSQAVIYNNRICTIPLSDLYASPYNLAQGASIEATVLAINFYGSSLSSPVGSGGIIVVVPFAPTGLVNNSTATTDTIVGITWTASVTGGSAVLHYSVYYD